MKIIKITFLLVLGLIITNCFDTTKTESLLNHTILKDEVYDAPVKTQVHLDILITDTTITEQKVREFLAAIYEKAIKRTGFKYHSNPTNIYIYAYTTKEKAASGHAQWIGMISKSYNDTKPEITISDTQLHSLSLKPIEKYGLAENVRLEIWNKIIKIEHKAQKEADIKYPLDNADITTQHIKKNGALFDKLKEKYEKVLSVKYEIDVTIFDSIAVEGLTKGWPFPKQ